MSIMKGVNEKLILVELLLVNFIQRAGRIFKNCQHVTETVLGSEWRMPDE